MSAPSLPEFDRTLQLSQGNLDSSELAEAHGLLCGLFCRDHDLTGNDFMHHLAATQLVVGAGEALESSLLDAYESTRRQMTDEELGFSLWLPGDEEDLEERTLALAQWCAGFLVGLGSGGSMDTLSEEAAEAIGDLQQIARAELSADSEVDGDNEEDEAAFAEIVEYVRIVALMLREDLRGPGQDDAIH